MRNFSNIFLNQKILIYGLGKSGLSAFEFLKKKNQVFLYDDYELDKKNLSFKRHLLDIKRIFLFKFDKIILSPGIDLNNCKLSKFLNKNKDKIYSDLDVFYSFYKNNCITITGTNGKSTTCQLLYKVLIDQKYDVKLVGNIGNPILSVKNVKKNTIFVVEASSYQLEYSKIFRSKYAAIINLSPDHLERHKTMNKYIKAKFKLIQNQLKGNLAFIKKNDTLIKNELKKKGYKSKIIRVDTNKKNILIKDIKNKYFFSEPNKENLLFVHEISKKLHCKMSLFKKTIQNFKGLKYRQEIIYQKKNLTIINDSKSTSFSSSIGVLKAYKNILWLLGGIPKKKDKFTLSKKNFHNIRGFIYGENKKFFNKTLKGKIKFENFYSLKDALSKIFSIIKRNKNIHQTILFSPSAASFDSFKNFEERGHYFNKLIYKYVDRK